MLKRRPLVMVVEDNFVLLKVAQGYLRKYGVDLKLARNGREALSLYTDFEFDLILMDVMMPYMNGLEAARAIRRKEAANGKHTPIVAITASEDEKACLEAGMDDYVSKPADYDRVMQAWLPRLETLVEVNNS